MIRSVKHKGPEPREADYTEAVCDGCEAACPESKILGTRGDKIRDRSLSAAHDAGWVDRDQRKTRGRRSFLVVALVCPACQAKAKEAASHA